MKKFLLIFLLLTAFYGHCQKYPGSITLIDGSTISGLVKVTSDSFKFYANEDSKAVEYDYTLARSAQQTVKGKEEKFEMIVVEEGKKPKLLHVEIDGYLKLYSSETSMYVSGATWRDSSTLYLKKDHEPVAQYFAAFGYIPKIGFRKVVMKYFTDCQYIIDQVRTSKWWPRHADDIVNYYNSNCKP